MKPSAPKSIVWILGLVAGILGILGHFAQVPLASDNSSWLLMGGFLLLAIGTSFKGV